MIRIRTFGSFISQIDNFPGASDVKHDCNQHTHNLPSVLWVSGSSEKMGDLKTPLTRRKRRTFFDLIETRATSRTRFRSLWHASAPALLSRLRVSQALEEHVGCVNTICWNADGTLLVSGSDDCRICIWRYSGGGSARLRTVADTGHCRNIFCARFVPLSSDEAVVTAACDGQVRLINLSTEHSQQLGVSCQFVSKCARLLSTRLLNLSLYCSHSPPYPVRVEFIPQDGQVFIATGQVRARVFHRSIHAGTRTTSPLSIS